MSLRDTDFWTERYDAGRTPWDDGLDDPGLLGWLDEGSLAPAAGPVLVPGCGSGRDVALLASRGFSVTGLDFTGAAVALARARLAALGLDANAIVQADVLDWQPAAPAAVVYERTCLCALHPDQWGSYAAQLHSWLRPGGRLFAQFEQVPRPQAAQGVIEGPPYHCDINAMRALFPSSRWQWAAPPYDRGARGLHLATVLTRND